MAFREEWNLTASGFLTKVKSMEVYRKDTANIRIYGQAEKERVEADTLRFIKKVAGEERKENEEYEETPEEIWLW